MNSKNQSIILSFLLLIGFAIMATLVSQDKVKEFDNAIISFVQGLESPSLTSILKVFTFTGTAPAMVTLIILILFFLYKVLHHRSELILFIATILGANILFKALKEIFQRERPNLHRLIEETGYSFPSGHSTNAMALYGILAYLLWRHIPVKWGRITLIIASVLMILIMGISRIYLGVHYPSDVLGGYIISGLWLSIVIPVYQHYKGKREYKKNSTTSIEKSSSL